MSLRTASRAGAERVCAQARRARDAACDAARARRAGPERDSRACQPTPRVRPGQNTSMGDHGDRDGRARPGALGAWSADFARGRGPSAYANPAHYWVASVASLPPSLPSSLSLIPPSVCSPKVGGSTTHLFQLQVVSLSSIADSELLCTAELVFTAYANSTSEHTGRILRNLSW